ncbi:hypothetical protein BX667DRAFT_510357 [Coemansia mojavensis]|nr:hypothetical protein BX667DRAFT_510357 [Coemansia mojavensis]
MRVLLFAAGWWNGLRDNLEDLVQSVHHLAVYGSQFAQYILIRELELDPQFFSRLQDQFRRNEKPIDEFAAFFDTCLMALTAAIKIAARVFSRPIVQQYVEAYQQAAATSYKNAILANFGKTLDRVAKVLLWTSEHKQQLEAEMSALENIRRTQQAQIWHCILKQSMEQLHPHTEMPTARTAEAQMALEPFLSALGIYEDVKAAPLRHLGRYFAPARTLGDNSSHRVQCFPLHTSWIPAYMSTDTKIVSRSILGNMRTVSDFNPLLTNGVTISIQKKKEKKEEENKGKDKKDKAPYIHRLSQEQLQN